MALTGAQQEQLLLNRRAHLQRMRGIYQERHNLNMQVRTASWRTAAAGGACGCAWAVRTGRPVTGAGE